MGEIYSFILDEYLLNDYAVLGARTIAGKVMIPNLVELQSKSRPWNQTELGSRLGLPPTSCGFCPRRKARGCGLGPQASRTRSVKP